MKKLFFLFVTIFLVSYSFADVVINEIMYNPAPISDAQGEYLELYNTGPTNVDLIGYYCDAITYYQESNYVLNVDSYAVIAKNPGALIASNQFATNVIAKFTGFLNNTGKSLLLSDAESNQADFVAYENKSSSSWPYIPSSSAGPSIELINPSLENNNGNNWLISTNDYPNGTPGTQNTVYAPISPAKIIVNEIMYNPSGSQEGEYIELYNAGTSSVELLGYYFSLGIDYTQLTAYAIATGDYAVICMYTNAVIPYYLSADPSKFIGEFTSNGWATNSFNGLNNSGEMIELRDNLGQLVNAVEYEDSYPWPSKADGQGSSLELRDPSLDNSKAFSWLASDNEDSGTPSYQNSRYGDSPDEKDFEFVDEDTYVIVYESNKTHNTRTLLKVESEDIFYGTSNCHANTWLKFDMYSVKTNFDMIHGAGWQVDGLELLLQESANYSWISPGGIDVSFAPDNSWDDNSLVYTNEFLYTNNLVSVGGFTSEAIFISHTVDLDISQTQMTENVEIGGVVSFRITTATTNTAMIL
ncbi:lamin tail domain-containing protein, partial [bacterium]|nr:lamin tail domain-containing protein [bacterium]